MSMNSCLDAFVWFIGFFWVRVLKHFHIRFRPKQVLEGLGESFLCLCPGSMVLHFRL